MVGLKIAVVCFVAMADIVAPVKQEAPAVATEAPSWVQPETEAMVFEAPTQIQHTQSVESVGFTAYRVAGKTPPIEWQQYLYGKLEERGIAWFMPYAMCQIQQESNWSQWSDNGQDKGLTQQKAVYWADRTAAAGWPGADIFDPYAQLNAYAFLMSQYLAVTGYSVEGALSLYFLGYPGYSAEYVGHVMRWMGGLEVVK